MTLCIAWRDDCGAVHFASDSRLTLATNSFADVGVKVLGLQYQVLNPDDSESGPRTVAFSGELGMCFAGSAVNSLTIKESLAEVLKTLRHKPSRTDTSMNGIASFIFTAYKVISQRICETAIAGNGRAEMLVGGLCQKTNSIRVFRFTTDEQNQHSYREVLENSEWELVGSGASAARGDIPTHPTGMDYLNVLRSVIANPGIESVGGNIQYGRFEGDRFVVHSIYEMGPPVHHWRGGLDLYSQDFTENESGFLPGVPLLDPHTLGI